jgi:tRNA(fMet)-specific endonuclease VapC
MQKHHQCNREADDALSRDAQRHDKATGKILPMLERDAIAMPAQEETLSEQMWEAFDEAIRANRRGMEMYEVARDSPEVHFLWSGHGDPWASIYGAFRNDPVFDEWQEAIRENRHQRASGEGTATGPDAKTIQTEYLYILDTDMLSLLKQGNEVVWRQREAHHLDLITVAISTVEEQWNGWQTLVRRAQSPERLAALYERLTQTITILAPVPIVTVTEAAIRRFETLKAMKLDINPIDLRIAAIALESGSIVVTRNRRDFERVPDLIIEDWSLPPPADATG